MKFREFSRLVFVACFLGVLCLDSVKAAERDYTVALAETKVASGHTHTCYNDGCPAKVDTGFRNSWDHRTNSEHYCQFCNNVVTIQDTRPARVTVFARVANNRYQRQAARAVWNPPTVKGVWNPPSCRNVAVAVVPESGVVEVKQSVRYSLQGAAVQFGGCSGAGCSTGVESARTGWYPGKLLGR